MADLAFTPSQLAARWQVSARTVYNLVEKGELGHIRVRSLIRIREADIAAYEAAHWHPPVATGLPSPNVSVASLSSLPGRAGIRDAFRTGQKSAAKRGC